MGRHEEGEAHVHTDPDARTFEWGAAQEGDYGGRLHVVADGAGSNVTIRLHIPDGGDKAENERALDQTAANVERLLSQ